MGEAGRSNDNQPPPVTTPEATNEKEESSESSSESSSDAEEKNKSERKKKKKNKKKKQKEKRKQKKQEKDKLKEALDAEEMNQKAADRLLSIDERKRPYNSMFEVKKPTDEELEAYYMKRRRDEDPMNQFM